jgi:hypothetical protein
MNFEQARDLSGRLASGRYGFDDLLLLLRCDFWLSPRDAPLGARFMKSGACTLADHLALEFGEGAEHLHQHSTGGAGSIDRFRKRPEFRAGGADAFENGQEVFERAGQAVELPDDERVARAELVEHLVQLGTLPSSAGRGFFEQPGASGVLERANLGRGILYYADTPSNAQFATRRSTMAGTEKRNSGVSCNSAISDARCPSAEMGSCGLGGQSAIFLSVKRKRWYGAFMSTWTMLTDLAARRPRGVAGVAAHGERQKVWKADI